MSARIVPLRPPPAAAAATTPPAAQVDALVWALLNRIQATVEGEKRLRLRPAGLSAAGGRRSAEAAALIDELEAALTHLSAANERIEALLAAPPPEGAA